MFLCTIRNICRQTPFKMYVMQAICGNKLIHLLVWRQFQGVVKEYMGNNQLYSEVLKYMLWTYLDTSI